MTTDELRDRLAVLCGWVWHCDVWWHRADGTRYKHPFPPNDYNALIAAWPEDWVWARWGDGTWIAQRSSPAGQPMVECVDTGDEYADRLRLTVAVLEASRP